MNPEDLKIIRGEIGLVLSFVVPLLLFVYGVLPLFLPWLIRAALYIAP